MSLPRRFFYVLDISLPLLLLFALIIVHWNDRTPVDAPESGSLSGDTIAGTVEGSAVNQGPSRRPGTILSPSIRFKPIEKPVYFGRVKDDDLPVTSSVLDLVAVDVDISGIAYSADMTITGTVRAGMQNTGPEPIEGPLQVTFFEDGNDNHTLDPDDRIIGQTQVTESLASGERVVVSAPVQGVVLFPQNLVWAWVDSSQSVKESNEFNNFANSGDKCRCSVAAGQFDPVVEWQVNAGNVIMAPAVVDVDANGIPDVVFVDYDSKSLQALRGNDGSQIWKVSTDLEGQAGIAVGDIDNDEKPEIIGATTSGSLVAFEHDGTEKWRSPAIVGSVQWGSAAIADLDHDGRPEIIIGNTVLNNDGTVRWQGSSGGRGRGDNGFGPLSIVADLDRDGDPEVIAGCSAYRADGTLMWNSSIADGFPAVGDFDGDKIPEIVVVSNSNVYLLKNDGNIIWGPVPIAGGGRGGPPTIADMDGDDKPEIGIAGATRYVVLDTDGSELWTSLTKDASSNATGSTVFDFEGDGSVEIVYGDETHLRIYRGKDGKVLYELPKPSYTTYELPLVVDVDADGNAEIVGVSNFGNRNGIYVIGDRSDSWVSTRQIWNQHSYHVTNVYDDGTIPKKERNSWEIHNTYRLNLHNDRDPQACPNLVAARIVAKAQAGDLATVTLRVGNAGAIHVPPEIQVAVYNGKPERGAQALAVAATKKRLAPGQYEDLSIEVRGVKPADVWVRVDDDGTGRGQVQESNEMDNLASAAKVMPSDIRSKE